MKLEYKKALFLLKESGFTLLSKRGSHMKFGKDKLRFILTEGGWNGTGTLHSKQSKELLEIIKGIETAKTIETHGN